MSEFDLSILKFDRVNNCTCASLSPLLLNFVVLYPMGDVGVVYLSLDGIWWLYMCGCATVGLSYTTELLVHGASSD